MPEPMLNYFLRYDHQCLLEKNSVYAWAMYSFFPLLVDLGINKEEYRMENVERHLWKQFGNRLVFFYQAPNRSLPCVVHAANLPTA